MITEKYVLFTRIPIYIDDVGNLYTDILWAKDLKAHLKYLNNFCLCCPVESYIALGHKNNIVDITGYGIKKTFPLRRDMGLVSVVSNFMPNFFQVYKAVNYGEIVHSGGAGWAFPLSFYILCLRPIVKFKWIMLIESSFWMHRRGEKVTVRRFLEHYIHKILIKWCLYCSDARIFTQKFYKEFFSVNDEKVLINSASWVSEEYFVTKEYIERKSEKGRDSINILFPARLEENKGVMVFLDALRLVSKKITTKVNVSIIGNGQLYDVCVDYSRNNNGLLSVNVLETIDYGKSFFEMLREYDIAVVANLAEEQPRIIFDCFSQGVPVLASDTTGVKEIVTDRVDSILFKRGSSHDLAEKILEILNDKFDMTAMAINAFEHAKNRTHSNMHAERERFLSEILS